MNKRIQLSLIACLVVTAGLMSACGGHDDTPGASGKLVQGPVKGATIFADNMTVGSGTRFVLDSGEVFTTTDNNGNYTLPSQPSYPYELVSKGGTDTLTEQPAIQMIAPAGSKNITPLTTLVALDTTGKIRAKIKELGADFDADISIAATPALLNLSKSIEAVVQAITESITMSAIKSTNAGTKVDISAPQLATIQAQTMQSIAITFGNSSADLAVPASLNALMLSAVIDAVAIIHDKNLNITIPADQAATIATDSVTAVVGADLISSTAKVDTGKVVLEETFISKWEHGALGRAIASIAQTVSTIMPPVVDTPKNYVPIILGVPHFTGSTGGTPQP